MFSALTQNRSLAAWRISRSLSRRCCIIDPDPPCKLEIGVPALQANCQPKDPTCPKEVIEKSFWESGCCEHPCAGALPRFDKIYYKNSDKAKRCYRQTWVECPAPVKKTRIYCCYDENKLPPIERRTRAQRPETACSMRKKEDCSLGKKSKCTKVVLPGCKSRRNTFHCLVDKNPSQGCPNRECAPYPSFSECIRRSIPPKKKKECGCVYDPNKCEIYREMEKWLWMKVKQQC